MFKDKVVVITGGAAGIGRAAAERFRQEGAEVAVIDIQENSYFTGDISQPETLVQFHDKVVKDFGAIDVLINNALPLMKGIDDCSYEEFLDAQQVGVAAPFYLSKLFKDDFTAEGSIINITSTRADMSQSQTESYSAAKGGLTSLTHALAMSLDIRVNAIAPGWIDTTESEFSGANHSQHPAGRVGKPEDIVEMMLFLASARASFITGQVFTVDGGMTRQMIYHNDQGWHFNG